MHQRVVEADQPAGRERLVREDERANFFRGKRDGDDAPECR